MDQLGITEDELDMFGVDGMLETGNLNNRDNDADSDDDDDNDGEEEETLFKPGGAGTMLPPFLQNLFGDRNKADGDNSNPNYEPFRLNELLNKDNAPSNDGDYESKERPHHSKRKEKDKDKKRKWLDTFCVNLNEKAKRGEIDDIIGRDREIERVTQILSRRSKNNPCLIGEPGVGKTAIAEGIARRLASGDVPYRLKGKILYMLDLTVLIAGTQFRGQFEQRVKQLIDEVKQNGNVIIFIDEVHTLVGTGGSDESMNAANMFKPALSRGDMQVIGATTFGEYRKHIEKDSALERRFQPVTVNEPTVEETAKLLLGIKKYYEKHHGVTVTDEMAGICAVMSERYINDRFLPDKAIDLLDEACACAVMANRGLAEYHSLEDKVRELSVEEETQLTSEDADYRRVMELRHEVAVAKKRQGELEDEVNSVKITEYDISKVIELWTGIPANKIMETEFSKIGKLEAALKEKIIGQDEACALVAAAVRRSRVQLSMRRRPASFIFVGETGVGKTELVKVLAEELFDSVEPLIRLDMSEYMEKHSVSRIIGSPPGYVGYEESGQLTEKVRRKPYSVVLFDEMEKAHPDVLNILLQILDEGKVNDAHGRSVSFEHTVICMTSNAGSTDKSTGVGFGKTTADISKDKAIKALKDFLRPEFISRIDEVVVFSPLTEENYRDIAKLMVKEMYAPLAEKKITLTVVEEVYVYIAKKAFGGKFGGRDIRRVIRKEVEDSIATAIIESSGGVTEVRVVVVAEAIAVQVV
jgi:ATP-dependent Clp protease ATP-binding subunit ClpA